MQRFFISYVAILSTPALCLSAALMCRSRQLSNELPLEDGPLQTVKKEVQEVDLIFTVTDHHNRFIRNFTPTQLSIVDNGDVAGGITYCEAQTKLPLRLALVIAHQRFY
jgi:hypothetical protein